MIILKFTSQKTLEDIFLEKPQGQSNWPPSPAFQGSRIDINIDNQLIPELI